MSNDLTDNRGFLNFNFQAAESIEDELTVDRMNAIIKAVNKNNITSVTGGYFREGSGKGKTLVCNASAGGGGSIVQPFQVIGFIPLPGSDDQFNATIQPGTVSATQVQYPNLGGSPMWRMVPTTIDGKTVYALPTLLVTKGDIIFIQAGVSMGVLTSLDIFTGTPPTEDDNTACYPFATCDPTTGSLLQTAVGNRGLLSIASYWNAGARLVANLWS